MPGYENRTRLGLEAALRELLEQKPLDQLRVRELTELCGLRRQSFYYHFKDVYELFAWTVERERALLLEHLEEGLTWPQAFLELLDRIAGNRAFYQAVLDQGGQKALGEMIPVDETLGTVWAYYRKRSGAPPESEEERRSGEAVVLSLVESWIRGTLTAEPGELIASLERTVERSTAGSVWQTLRERGDWDWL